MHQFTQDVLEQVREMTDLTAAVAIDDADYCKLHIGECSTIEASFGKPATYSVDGWEGANWTFATAGEAAVAAEHIEDAFGKLTGMARQSMVDKAKLDAAPKLLDAFDAFVANVLEVR